LQIPCRRARYQRLCANDPEKVFSERYGQSASLGATRRASATGAAVNGVIGSCAGMTSPIASLASGLTTGIARSASVRPSLAVSRAGILEARNAAPFGGPAEVLFPR
jgi:hypothetical protein